MGVNFRQKNGMSFEAKNGTRKEAVGDAVRFTHHTRMEESTEYGSTVIVFYLPRKHERAKRKDKIDYDDF
jgi:hypothetical protein